MTPNKAVLIAVAASTCMLVVGIVFNMPMLSASPEVAMVEPISIEIDDRTRAREEHGEIAGGDETTFSGVEPVYTKKAPPRDGWNAPDYETEAKKTKRRSISSMDRAAAIKKADDLNAKLQDPDLPEPERVEAEEELGMVLDEHFSPAAGESYGEPKGGPEQFARPGFWDKLDPNVVFNTIWGTLQALIIAWLVPKLRGKKVNEA